MPDIPIQSDDQAWLASGRWVRIGVRAIVFDGSEEKLLVEKNLEDQGYYNFIGGGLEMGETLEECLRREFAEENDAQISEVSYLFCVENFFYHDKSLLHGLEHYFLVKIASEQIHAKIPNLLHSWHPVEEIANLDLRPHAVRDLLASGNQVLFLQMISKDPP